MAFLDLENIAPHLERNSIVSIPEYRIKHKKFAVISFSFVTIIRIYQQMQFALVPAQNFTLNMSNPYNVIYICSLSFNHSLLKFLVAYNLKGDIKFTWQHRTQDTEQKVLPSTCNIIIRKFFEMIQCNISYWRFSMGVFEHKLTNRYE